MRTSPSRRSSTTAADQLPPSGRRRRRATAAAGVLVVALATALASCGSSSTADSGSGTPSGSAASSTGTLTVFAAASLKTTFTSLGKTFEQQHPGITVTFSFAGSQTLVEQVQQGAPVDVLATANTKTMKTVHDGGLLTGTPTVFATNELTIAVPPGNPAGVRSFADLAKSGTKVVICAPAVPCGTATQKVEQVTGTTLKPVSEEESVTDVLAKVQSGEADAGLVYRTDVKAAGSSVTSVDFAESSSATTSDPIAVLKDAKQATAAQQFVDLVLSAEGQRVLRDAGFGAPETASAQPSGSGLASAQASGSASSPS